MKGLLEKLDDFSVVGAKPLFMHNEEGKKGSA